MNNRFKVMLDMLSVTPEVLSIQIDGYDIVWNPNMNNGEYEVFDHDGDHTKYTQLKTSTGVISYITGEDEDGVTSVVMDLINELGFNMDADSIIYVVAEVRKVIEDGDDTIATVNNVMHRILSE